MSSVTAILDAISADASRTPDELLDIALTTAAGLEGDAGPLELDRPGADFVYVARAGDTLDLIAHRRYGNVSAVRNVQAANPDLAALSRLRQLGPLTDDNLLIFRDRTPKGRHYTARPRDPPTGLQDSSFGAGCFGNAKSS